MPGNHGEYREKIGKEEAARALQRGTDRGISGTAVYLAGERVRCIRHRESPKWPDHAGVCGGYLFTQGPESVALVRAYNERQFHERRRVPRGNFRCPRCEGQLEVEFPEATGRSAA